MCVCKHGKHGNKRVYVLVYKIYKNLLVKVDRFQMVREFLVQFRTEVVVVRYYRSQVIKNTSNIIIAET